MFSVNPGVNLIKLFQQLQNYPNLETFAFAETRIQAYSITTIKLELKNFYEVVS